MDTQRVWFIFQTRGLFSFLLRPVFIWLHDSKIRIANDCTNDNHSSKLFFYVGNSIINELDDALRIKLLQINLSNFGLLKSILKTYIYRQWTHVFKILREIDLLYEYYGHFHHVIDKTKNIGGTVPV